MTTNNIAELYNSVINIEKHSAISVNPDEWIEYIWKNSNDNTINKKKFIVCSGVSSSGKSSIIKEFVSMSSDSIAIPKDEIRFLELKKILFKNIPEHFHLLYKYFGNNIERYIPKKENSPFLRMILEKIDNTDEKKALLSCIDEAADFLKEKFDDFCAFVKKKELMHTSFLMHLGKTVVLDSVYYKDVLNNISKRAPSTQALVYCAPDVLINRIKRRNDCSLNDKNPSNIRDYQFVIQQFTILYDKYSRYKNNGRTTIDTITKSCLLESIQRSIDLNEEYGFGFPYIAYKNKEEFTSDLLSKIGFDANESEIDVCTDLEPDIILNTNNSTSNVLATMLKKYLDND